MKTKFKVWLGLLLTVALLLGCACALGEDENLSETVLNKDMVSIQVSLGTGDSKQELGENGVPIYADLTFSVNAISVTKDEDGNDVGRIADEVVLHIVEKAPDGAEEDWQPMREQWTSGPDEHGNVDFEWNAGYSATVWAEARYDNEWVRTDYVGITPKTTGDIAGELTLAEGEAVPENLSREDWLTLTVNSINDVNYYGICLRDEVGNQFADSQWVDAQGETTTITMPLYQCQIPQDYKICLYAIQVGYERKEVELQQTLHVTRAYTDLDLILSNPEEEYHTGDQISLAAFYNANEKIENTWLSISVHPEGDFESLVYEDRIDCGWGDGFTSVEGRVQDFTIWTEGTYVFDASILQGVEDEEPNWLTGDSRTFTVNAEEENLADKLTEYNPEIPGYFPVQIDAGTEENAEYTLTIAAPNTPAENWSACVINEDDNGIMAEAYAEGNEEISLKFRPWDGMMARVEIHAYAYDYNEHTLSWEHIPGIAVNTTEANEVTIWLDSDPKNINDRVNIHVSAPGANWIELFDSNSGWNNPEHRDADDEVFENWSVGENGEFRVWAKAGFFNGADGQENDETLWNNYTTDALVYHLNTQGDVGKFSISYGENETKTNDVHRGDKVQINFTEAEHADNYWLNIGCQVDEGADGWEFEPKYSVNEDEHTLTLNTAGMPVGEYWITGLAASSGYHTYDTGVTEDGILYLNVRDASQEKQIILDVSAQEVSTMENIEVSALAQGADWMQLFLEWPDEDNQRDNGGGEYFYTDISFDRAGKYQIVARAGFPTTDENGEYLYETDENGNTKYDDWGHPMHLYNVVDSDPVTINVSVKENHDLAFGNIDVPLKLNLSDRTGESAINFTLPMPDNAAKLYVEVRVNNPDGSSWENPIFSEDYETTEDDENPGIKVNLTWDVLQDVSAGQTLMVNAHASAPEYNAVDWSHPIPVIAAENEAQAYIFFMEDDEVIVDEQNAPVTEWSVDVNKEIHVVITGADSRKKKDGEEDTIQTVRFFNGQSLEDDTGINDGDNNRHNANTGLPEAGTYTLYAQVTYMSWNDDWNSLDYDPRTWYTTNLLTVNVKEPEKTAGDFTISFVGGKDTFTRGDTVQVQFTKSENATNYWLNNNDGLDLNQQWDDEGLTMSFTTVDINPGKYVITGWAGGEGVKQKSSPSIAFNVVEPENKDEYDNGILFQISANEVLLGEPVAYSIYAPGASHVGFYLDGNPWHYNEDGSYTWGNEGDVVDSWYDWEHVVWYDGGDVGEHTLQAEACFEGNWIKTKEYTVKVTKKGDLSFDISNLPTYLPEKQSAELKVQLPENAERMRVSISEEWYDPEDENADENGWVHGSICDGSNLTKDYTVTILGGEEGFLWEDHWIVIRADASAVGYIGTDVEVRIPVTLTAGAGATLKLESGNIGTTDAPAVRLDSDNVEIKIIPDEGKKIAAIRFYDGYGYWEDGAEINRVNHPDWFIDAEDSEDGEDGEVGKSYVSFSLRYDQGEGKVAVYAQVLLDSEDETNDWFNTEVLELEVKADGDTASFDFVNSGEELGVERGTYAYLEFTLPKMEGIDKEDYNFWANVYTQDGQYIDLGNVSTFLGLNEDEENGYTATVALSAVHLEEGDYTVRGFAKVNGFNQAESDSEITLHVFNSSTGEAILTLNRVDYHTLEQIGATFYAPGASRVYITRDDEESPETADDGWEGETWQSDENWYFNKPGTHTIQGWAYYTNEENESESGWASTEIQYVYVNADKGKLGEFDFSSVPSVSTEKTGVGFEIDRPEDVEWVNMQVRLRKNGEEGESITLADWTQIENDKFGWGTEDGTGIAEDEEETPFTLEAGDILEINIQAFAVDYVARYDGIQIRIIPATDENDSDSFSFKFKDNPYGDDIEEDENGIITLQPNKDYYVFVNNSSAQKIRLFDGYDYAWLDDNGKTIFEGESYTYTISYDKSGTYTLYAQAYVEEEDDAYNWVTSVMKNIKVVGDDDAGSVDVDVPEEVIYGTDPDIAVGTAEDAWYSLIVRNMEGFEYFHKDYWVGEGSNVKTEEDGKVHWPVQDESDTEDKGHLPTGEYEVEVTVYQTGRNANVSIYSMKVVEPSIRLTSASGRRNFHYGDEVEFLIVTEGIELKDVKLYRKATDEDEETQEIIDKHDSDLLYWTANKLTDEEGITFTAKYVGTNESGKDIPVESYDFTLWVFTNGPAPMPNVDWPQSMPDTANNSQTINVSNVPEGVDYVLSLKQDTGEEELKTIYTWPTNTEATSYMIPVEKEDSEETNSLDAGTYYLTVTTSGTGYDDGYMEMQFDIYHEHEPVFTWTDEWSEGKDITCTVKLVCKNCQDVENGEEPISLTVPQEEADRHEATCTDAGSVTYHAYGSWEDWNFNEYKTYEFGTATGHNWSDWEFDWEEIEETEETQKGGVNVWLKRHCEVCGEEQIAGDEVVSEGLLVTKDAESSKEPTCTESGQIVWNASITIKEENKENTEEEDETKTIKLTESYTVHLEPLGHNWGEWTSLRAATCEMTGEEQSICNTNREHVRTKNTPKLEHDWEYSYEVSDDALTSTEAVVTVSRICAYDTGDEKTHAEVEAQSVTGRELMQAPTENESGLIRLYADFENPHFKDYEITIDLPALKELNVLRLPAGLTQIDDEAFSGIGAQAIIIPAGVTNIGNGAFNDCPNLLYVQFEGEPRNTDGAFQNCPLLAVFGDVQTEEDGE